MEPRPRNFLLVISCLGLVLMIAMSIASTRKTGKLAEWFAPVPELKAHHLEVDAFIRPVQAMGQTAALQVPLKYCHNPEECPHADGLRAYMEGTQSFKICDQ